MWMGILLLTPGMWSQGITSAPIPSPDIIINQRVPSSSDSTTDKDTSRPQISAHRGGRFIAGYPENALETFQFVSEQVPVIIECDVNMSSDSVLFLMHDNTLGRTTTSQGVVQETEWTRIQDLYLRDDYGIVTRYNPPTLIAVMEWAFNKARLTLDVKRGVPIEKVVEMVRNQGAIGYASVITYNYEDALKAYLADPRIMLSVNIRNEEELQRYLNGPFQCQNLMAFTGLTERTPEFYKSIKEAGIKVIIGTMGNLDNSAAKKGDQVYRKLRTAGADILATDRPIAVYKAFL